MARTKKPTIKDPVVVETAGGEGRAWHRKAGGWAVKVGDGGTFWPRAGEAGSRESLIDAFQRAGLEEGDASAAATKVYRKLAGR